MALPKPIEYATVPRDWPDETAVVIGSGPSLTADDVEHCRGRARVIALKDAVQLAPWADVLYACGNDASHWWPRHGPSLTFAGARYALEPYAVKWGARILRDTGEAGLETAPDGVRTGKNSAYQAVNLAVHYGVTRVLLLGVDMGHSPHSPKYFYGDRKHQLPSPYGAMLALWPTLIEPLKTLGVELINCSRQTALDCFHRVPINEALS